MINSGRVNEFILTFTSGGEEHGVVLHLIYAKT
jgi:hypothetical protein